MSLLLDTHILLWYASNDGQLSKKARDLIADSGSAYCSIVSAWEVAIKHNLNPARMPLSGKQFFECIRRFGCGLLALKEEHVQMLETLRLARGAKEHHDPFDRMLICQAKAEGMTLLTHDALLQGYGESCVLRV